MALTNKRSKAKGPAFACDECGGVFSRWEGKCPACGAWNTLRETSAKAAKGARQKRSEAEPLPAAGRAVVERLVEGLRGQRRRAEEIVSLLLAPRPGGYGLEMAAVIELADEVIHRHRQSPRADPMAYMVTLAKSHRRGRGLPRGDVPNWDELQNAGPMQALKDVIEEVREKLPVVTQVASGPLSWPHRLPFHSCRERCEDGECIGCGGAGFVRRPLRLSDEGIVPQLVAPCRSCGGEKPEERVARLLAVSGLEPAHLKMRLADLQPVDGLEPALAAAQRFLEGEVSQLVLTGGTGRGKTHIAVGVLRECIERGEAGFYLNVARFLERLRSTYSDKSDEEPESVLVAAMTWPVVVLDDVGAERQTEWAREKLYEIVDARYANELRTIACSNFDTHLWEPRVLSRLLDRQRSATVTLATPDYRLQPVK